MERPEGRGFESLRARFQILKDLKECLCMSKKRSNNAIPIIFIAAILVAALFFLFSPGTNMPAKMDNNIGHTAEDTGAQVIAEPTTIVQLTTILPRARNFDSDAERDGIDVVLSPKDAYGNLETTDGTINARIWRSAYDVNGTRMHGDLIESWSGISISKSSYDDYGYRLVLPFRSYVPQPNDYGFFEIALTTPDGKEFAAEEVLLSLGATG